MRLALARPCLLLAAALLGGCAGKPSTSGALSARGAAVPLVRREADDHPPVSLMMRLGDPQPGVAFAAAHDQGSVASVAVAELLLARLRAAGLPEVASDPHALGLSLSMLAENPAQARGFVRAVQAGLAAPIRAGDPALSAVKQSLEALRVRSFGGAAEAAVASCSGELGLEPGRTPPNLDSAAGLLTLEAYRQSVYSAQASAFAAVGATTFLEAVADAVAEGSAWPADAHASDAWPSADAIGVDVSNGPRRLSLALRIADPNRAVSAARALADPNGDLALRVRAFSPGFRLERAVASARPRGACLRIDLRGDAAEPGPTAPELARTADALLDEADYELGRASTPNALDESVVRPPDPRDAASAAAWRTLVGRLEPEPERRFVAVVVHPAERTQFSSFAAELGHASEPSSGSDIELRVRVEAGQSELWMLVGSPCGTHAEATGDAGNTAFALALAARLPSSGVTLEPWATPDGVGLLAHAPREGASESPEAHAERVARALARALADDSIQSDDWLAARSELYAEIGSRPRPGYARILDALAPGHASWLDARGLWQSLTEATRDEILAHRRALVRGPLRIAVLANHDAAQAHLAARALGRFLEPARASRLGCPTTAPVSPRAQQLQLESAGSDAPEGTYLGFSLEPGSAQSAFGAALLALLGARSEFLNQALATAGISGNVRARLLGGNRAAALLLELSTADADRERAVSEVKAALARLSRSALSAEQTARLERLLRAQALKASLDPRRRAVDLWRGAPLDPHLDPGALNAWLAALATRPELQVSVTERN